MDIVIIDMDIGLDRSVNIRYKKPQTYEDQSVRSKKLIQTFYTSTNGLGGEGAVRGRLGGGEGAVRVQ